VSRNMEKMVSGTCPWAENLKKKQACTTGRKEASGQIRGI